MWISVLAFEMKESLRSLIFTKSLLFTCLQYTFQYNIYDIENVEVVENIVVVVVLHVVVPAAAVVVVVQQKIWHERYLQIAILFSCLHITLIYNIY